MPKPLVSFCTVAMNRCAHIQKTLTANLHDNPADGIEFVLLDYSSRDGLAGYIKTNFQAALESGRLIYYHYPGATTFHRSHSRNMAIRLAKGDVVVNVDADNYVGPAFGAYLQDVFAQRPNICLTGLGNPHTPDANGKLCATREGLLQVSGYDEAFEGYGFEDYDIVNRLRFAGCEPYTITNPSYLRAETHAIGERIFNEPFVREVEMVLVDFIDPHKSRVLYLLANGSYRAATVVNQFTIDSDKPFKAAPEEGYPTIHYNIEGDWEQGTWSLADHVLRLESGGTTATYYGRPTPGRQSFKGERQEYYQVSNELRLDAVMFYTQLRNRELMMENLTRQRIRVNKVFGAGTVYKNFQDEPIEL